MIQNPGEVAHAESTSVGEEVPMRIWTEFKNAILPWLLASAVVAFLIAEHRRTTGALLEANTRLANAVEQQGKALECVPPELCGDIYERGVVLTGGVAFLRRLDEHLHKETGLPVVKAGEPLATVVIGAGRLLNDRALLSKVAVN